MKAFCPLLLAPLVAGALLACGDPAPDPPVQNALPCDVGKVMLKCQTCHSAPPTHNAPFALVTYADTQASYYGEPIWKLMGQDVKTGRMPLALVTLDANERDAVVQWAEAGGQLGAACP